MKRWKNKTRFAVAAILACCLFTTQIYAAEPARPDAVTVPAPYVSMEFDDANKPFDPNGNATFTVHGGSVGAQKVHYRDQEYTATGYRGTADQEYIDLALDKITSAEAWEDFLLGGSSFEIFAQLDQAPGATVGFLTSANGGGMTVYIRQEESQLNFQIGNTTETGTHHAPKYSMASPDKPEDGGQQIEAGKVVHVVGTYDPAENTLNIYYNGVLVGSGDFGTKEFNLGSAKYNHLGIGINISYMPESLGKYTPYTVLGTRIYDKALTAEQVAAEYYACVDTLTGGPVDPDPEPEEPTAPTDPDPEDPPKTSDVSFMILLLFAGVLTATLLGKRYGSAR